MTSNPFGCELSRRVLSRLTEIGWYPERTVDIAHCEELLHAAGAPIFTTAQAVLQSLGSLPLHGPTKALRFSAETLELWTDDTSAVSRCQGLAGEDICPLGGSMIYGCFVGASGRVYIIDMDESTFWKCESICAFLEFVLFGDIAAATITRLQGD